VNMLTKAFAKFIQRKRIYCDDNPCCFCYGVNIVMYPDGRTRGYCDKHLNNHFNKQPTNKDLKRREALDDIARKAQDAGLY
jgi:hypothetical protein